MDKTILLEQKMNESLAIIKEAIDLSAEIKAGNGDRGNKVNGLWEDFLKQFFSYVKQKSHASGYNLMYGISWNRIKP